MFRVRRRNLVRHSSYCPRGRVEKQRFSNFSEIKGFRPKSIGS